MTYQYTPGLKGQKWDSFIFVASYQKSDSTMKISKLAFQFKERSGATWATCWADVARVIKETCDKNKSKVSTLRLAAHGNPGTFSLGSTLFDVKNAPKWIPDVAKLAGYFVPDVSLVIIDACKVGRDDMLLQLFSMALGGVSVRGYVEDQSAVFDNSGDFVTCKMEVCTTTPN